MLLCLLKGIGLILVKGGKRQAKMSPAKTLFWINSVSPKVLLAIKKPLLI
jgi:hypothetical protein